jgi:hypothetical protein
MSVDNIKMDLRETEWDMDWIDVAQDRDQWRALVNMVISSINAGKFLNGCATGGFSRRAQLRECE